MVVEMMKLGSLFGAIGHVVTAIAWMPIVGMGYAIFKVTAAPPLPTADKLRSTSYK